MQHVNSIQVFHKENTYCQIYFCKIHSTVFSSSGRTSTFSEEIQIEKRTITENISQSQF